MSTAIELKESPPVWQPPAVKPLDEGVWEAWKEKSREQERRRKLAVAKVTRCASVAVLLAAAALGSRLAPYEWPVRVVVVASLLALSAQAFRAGRVPLAAAFGLVAVLYNPVAPAFDFSNSWERAILVASSIPFLLPLIWPDGKEKRHV